MARSDASLSAASGQLGGVAQIRTARVANKSERNRMRKKTGYARVSAQHQNLERQIALP
jgi:predicted site-specific integrase-resolvase